MKYTIIGITIVPFVMFYLVASLGHLGLCLVNWKCPVWAFFVECWWQYGRFVNELGKRN